MGFFIYSLLLWLFFIATANVVKYTSKQTPMIKRAPATVFTLLFIVGDVIFNVTYGSIVFLQLPHYKRLTLTERLKYNLVVYSDSWRGKLSYWICRRLVEPWDQHHCGLRK